MTNKKGTAYLTVKLGEDGQPEVEVGTENMAVLGALCAAAVSACALNYASECGQPASNFVLSVQSTIIDLVSKMGG